MEIQTMTRPLCDSRPTSRPQLETLEDRLVPSTMAADYADGVWRYDTTAGWAHISNLQASLLDVDDAGDVYGAFSSGLWRWSAATASWSHPSSLMVNQFQVTASGILYGDFVGSGLWRWDPSSNGWAHLSDLHPSTFPGIAVSDSDAFFGYFSTGSVGTWRWTPTAGWSLLTAYQPAQFQTDTAGDFVGDFTAAGVAGTWRWSPTAGWARLSTTAPISIAVSANGAIFEDRGTNGLWRAAPGATSVTQIDSTSAAFLTALPDGSLFAKRYVSGDYSGWYWNSSEPGFGLFRFLPSIDSVAERGIGKDGDLFFRDATVNADGTGYFSSQSPYHLLTGLNIQQPTLLVSQR
jgi:hypothetical protein